MIKIFSIWILLLIKLLTMVLMMNLNCKLQIMKIFYKKLMIDDNSNERISVIPVFDILGENDLNCDTDIHFIQYSLPKH